MIHRLGLIAFVASLLGACDPGIDGHPHHAPADGAPACWHPPVGVTCPAPLDDPRDFVDGAAWCPDGALLIDERPGGDVEFSCAPEDGSWRIVVGVVARASGVAYLAEDGALVVCNLAGRVDAVMPLLTDESGRFWHALVPADADCLDNDTCELVSDPCWR